MAPGSEENSGRPKRQLDAKAIYEGRTQDLITAVGHRDRRRILRILHEAREGRSPNEIAQTLYEPVGRTSYHIKVLKKSGAVALTGTRPARGALEHFYISTVADSKFVMSALTMTAGEDEEY